MVPGGSTNVFARALGLPKDWAEGTGVILEALRAGPDAGRSAWAGPTTATSPSAPGFGLDAEVVRRVEQARLRGRTSTPALYLRSTIEPVLPGDGPPARR